jgi:hypothetical protein
MGTSVSFNAFMGSLGGIGGWGGEGEGCRKTGIVCLGVWAWGGSYSVVSASDGVTGLEVGVSREVGAIIGVVSEDPGYSRMFWGSEREVFFFLVARRDRLTKSGSEMSSSSVST